MRLLLRSTFHRAWLCAALALAAAASHADVRLPVSGGDDRWSRHVQADWAPRTRAALLNLEAFARARYEVELGAQLNFALASTPAAARPEGATPLLVEAGLSESELRQRALLQPLRQGTLSLIETLSQGHAKRLPPWLKAGFSEMLARQTVASLGLPPLPAHASEPPLFRAEGRDARNAERLLETQRRDRSLLRISQAAVERLQERLGADFHPRMKAYLQAGAQADFDAEAVFIEQFGISQTAFLQQVEQQGSAHVQVEADAPADESQAGTARPQVTVRMGGYVTDDFARQVEQDWLGPVREASAQFDRLVNERLKVSLSRGARIYIGAGVADYEQILQQDMGMRADRAELQGEVSGGLSNSRGQIALKFTPKQSRAAAYELAVKTTLHELTHELQKQLDDNHAGFKPPVWLREGTADLIAYQLAPQVRIGGAEADAMRNWRERNLAWWRKGNKTELQPEDMLGVTSKEWLGMMKAKRGAYQMAGLMSMYLQAITGERFLAAWVDYYRLAGRKGQSADEAFERSFGLSEADFVADFKRWLVQQ